jgi:drug/metabolite transporter (DMT)-like permease
MVWALIAMTDWVFHGMWMNTWYEQTSTLWRSEGEMRSTIWAMWVGYFAFAWAYVWIFTKGLSNDQPWWQAFRYAWAIFALASIPRLLAQWAVMPIPTDIIFRWFAIEGVQVFACAFTLTWAYRPKIAWQRN